MKKFLFLLSTVVYSTLSYSQSVPLTDYNWSTDDVAEKGLTKEALFKSMDRSFIKTGASICSNRALLWLYDWKRKYDVDGSKLFLFYTGKTGDEGAKTWWYHVTPMIVENGVEYTMDAGFGSIKTPLLVNDWMKKFAGSTNCKEIRNNETDLIDRMFRGQVYPETTKYGTYDCYYKKVPASYWTPASVAMNLLGVLANGEKTVFERPEIDTKDVYEACREASTRDFSYSFGGGAKRCKKYLGL